MLALYDLTVEQKTAPLGLDEKQPAFSWKLKSERQGVLQKSYHIMVSDENGTVWDSGEVQSEQSSFVCYAGAALKTRAEYAWTVEVSDGTETAKAESRFETGLLDGRAFEGYAEWITHPLPAEEAASPVFTKIFCVEKEVKRARLYATALGLYEAEVNGQKPDDTYFAPGWTNYHKRLQYQSYPVALTHDVNELRFTLGRGWYCGKLGFDIQPNNYISVHLHEPFGVEDLAEHCNLCRRSLFLRFKKEIGIGIVDYVQREKIAEARFLLEHTELVLPEISSHLNYSSQSYFTAQFKKIVGEMPERYRNQKKLLR